MASHRNDELFGLTIRPLTEDDRQALIEHWRRLGSEDLRLRYFRPVTDAYLVRRGELLDFETPKIWAAVVAGIVVSTGEWAPSAASPLMADFAFSTLASHRLQGFARKLAVAMAGDALARGLSLAKIDALSDNASGNLFAEMLGGSKMPAADDGTESWSVDLLRLQRSEEPSIVLPCDPQAA